MNTLLNKIIRIIEAVEYCDSLTTEFNRLFFQALKGDIGAVNHAVNQIVKLNNLEV
jgi:hypothetical protein